MGGWSDCRLSFFFSTSFSYTEKSSEVVGREKKKGKSTQGTLCSLGEGGKGERKKGKRPKTAPLLPLPRKERMVSTLWDSNTAPLRTDKVERMGREKRKEKGLLANSSSQRGKEKREGPFFFLPNFEYKKLGCWKERGFPLYLLSLSPFPSPLLGVGGPR